MIATLIAALALTSPMAADSTKPLPTFTQFSVVNPDQMAGSFKNQANLTPAYWGNGWVVMDFWHVHCEPCTRVLPDISQLASKLAGQGVKLVGMSIDETSSGAPNPQIVKARLERLAKAGNPLLYPTVMVPADYRRSMNAVIANKPVSEVTQRMNVPLMVLVKGNRIYGWLTGTKLESIYERAKNGSASLADLLFNEVMGAVRSAR